MKLPFGAGKSKPARARAAAPDSAVPAKSFSLRSQMLLLMIAGVLLIGAPPAVVYLQTVQQLEDSQQRQAELGAELFAGGYRQWVARQAAAAELAAADAELARQLLQEDAAAREQKAASLAILFPNAIRVRLLSPGIDEVDPQASPPISYAALDMLRHAETKDTPPPVEVHMSGTAQTHVNLVRRVLDPADQRVVGNLMISYPLKELQDLLRQADVGGYAELQQVAGGTPLVLASRGDAALKQGEADSAVTVTGSRWRVAYWTPGAAASGSRDLLVSAAGTAAVAVVLMLLLTWAVFKKLLGALRRDQATLLTVV
jgi:phosphomannomutase/phosphoglucomutase